MAQVKLNRKSGTFRRSVRNAKGKILKTMEFHAGEVCTVTGRDLDAVALDIEKGALIEVTTEDGKVRPVKPPVVEPFKITREQYDRDIAKAREEGHAQAIDDLPDQYEA